jgi:hypothetical protein
MFELLIGLNVSEGFYFVGDKYYCSGRFMKQLVNKNIPIVTMMKRNAEAYFPPIKPTQSKHGRPEKYGPSVKLFSLFDSKMPF